MMENNFKHTFPDELIEEILKLSIAGPYQLLEKLLLSKRISEALSKDEVWQPYFESYFPHVVKNRNETYKHAFIRITQFILNKVQNNPRLLQNISNLLISNTEFILAVVKMNGLALEYVPRPLQSNPKLVKAAITQNGLALEFASSNLQNNLAIVRAAIAENGNALRYASPALQDRSALVLEAVAQDGDAFEYASDRLRRHRTTVLAAVASDSRAFQHANGALRNEIINYIWCLRFTAILESVVGGVIIREPSPLAGGLLLALAVITGFTSYSYSATARVGIFFTRCKQQNHGQIVDEEDAEETEESKQYEDEYKLL